MRRPRWQGVLFTGLLPIKQLGWEMAKMLVSVIDGDQPGPLILPTRLVIRESSEPVAITSGGSS
jgi:DNA-binding LacI/PurR family transcriptional regulator